jgi:hypothetical protein
VLEGPNGRAATYLFEGDDVLVLEDAEVDDLPLGVLVDLRAMLHTFDCPLGMQRPSRNEACHGTARASGTFADLGYVHSTALTGFVT